MNHLKGEMRMFESNRIKSLKNDRIERNGDAKRILAILVVVLILVVLKPRLRKYKQEHCLTAAIKKDDFSLPKTVDNIRKLLASLAVFKCKRSKKESNVIKILVSITELLVSITELLVLITKLLVLITKLIIYIVVGCVQLF